MLLGGYNYWRLSYVDNRYSFAIARKTTNNVMESDIIKTMGPLVLGTSIAFKSTQTSHEVIFVGQAGEVTTLSFDPSLPLRRHLWG